MQNRVKSPDHKTYESIDKNRNSFIELSEFKNYALSIDPELDPNTSFDTLKKDLDLSDFIGSDSKLDFEEFNEWILYKSKLCFM